jgi:hypothetical protein
MNLRVLKTAAFVLASTASLSAFSAAPAAAAVTVAFKFDNMGSGGSTSQGVQSSRISTYMTNVLSSYYAGATVNVSGAVGQQGPLANSPTASGSYAGEGYVVGPKSGSTVTPYTLANTNGGVYETSSTARNNDGFIKNCAFTSECGGATSADIFINFNGHHISSFSFDFEIFPDGTCPKLNVNIGDNFCGLATGSSGLALNPKLPDLEIYSGDNGTGTPFGTLFGVKPGTGGTYSYSTNSGANAETAPQLLGTATYIVSGSNITTLDFMDWPETIGIDNLKVTFIPEPPTLAFLALGFIGLTWIARRKRVGLAQLFSTIKRA